MQAFFLWLRGFALVSPCGGAAGAGVWTLKQVSPNNRGKA